MNVQAIIATRSEVTTVSETWVHSHFLQTKPAYLNWCGLKSSHGLDNSHIGIVDVTLPIGAQTLTHIWNFSERLRLLIDVSLCGACSAS